MPKAPRVSVCVPTYNGAAYLRECLESASAQTMDDMEIVVCDDCSSDATMEIAQAHSTMDSRVRVIRSDRNAGLVGNWNRCAKAARGEWIKFLFQDDLLDPRCLEHMLGSAKQSVPIIACRREFRFEADVEATRRAYYEQHLSWEKVFPGRTDVSASDFCAASLAHIGINFVGEPTAVLLHRSAFEKYGLFNPHLIMICDSEYWARVAVNCGMHYVPETLATFRVHPGATSAATFAGRDYRMHLDWVVLEHEFVFNPCFEPLREHARRQVPPIDLAALLLKDAQHKRWIAVDAAHRADSPTDDLRQQWVDVERRLPKLSAMLRASDPKPESLFSRARRRARRWLGRAPTAQ